MSDLVRKVAMLCVGHSRQTARRAFHLRQLLLVMFYLSLCYVSVQQIQPAAICRQTVRTVGVPPALKITRVQVVADSKHTTTSYNKSQQVNKQRYKLNAAPHVIGSNEKTISRYRFINTRIIQLHLSHQTSNERCV